jgi:hypothetical protein
VNGTALESGSGEDCDETVSCSVVVECSGCDLVGEVASRFEVFARETGTARGRRRGGDGNDCGRGGQGIAGWTRGRASSCEWRMANGEATIASGECAQSLWWPCEPGGAVAVSQVIWVCGCAVNVNAGVNAGESRLGMGMGRAG